MSIDLTARLQNLVEERDVRLLLARFADAVNLNDAAAFGQLWTEDAEWQIGAPMNVSMAGRDNVTGMFSNLMAKWKFFFQMNFDGLISFDGEKAHVRAFVHEVGVFADGNTLRLWGRYEDDLQRSPKGWLFRRRAFHFHCSDAPALVPNYLAPTVK